MRSISQSELLRATKLELGAMLRRIGWFQLKVPIGRRRSKAERLVAGNEFVKLAKKAARWKIQPTMVDPVKVPENGGLKAGEDVWMYFDEKAVRSAAVRKDLEGSKPLIVG
jgi:hypothetical protein